MYFASFLLRLVTSIRWLDAFVFYLAFRSVLAFALGDEKREGALRVRLKRQAVAIDEIEVL